MIEISRRNLIRGGALAGGAAAVGGGWALFRTREQLLEEILRRALPGVQFEREGLKLFKKEFFQFYEMSFGSRLKLRASSVISGIVGVGTTMNISTFKQRLLTIEREAITLFLTYSDFFLFDDPRSEPVTYWGLDPEKPCPNPFARFDF